MLRAVVGTTTYKLYNSLPVSFYPEHSVKITDINVMFLCSVVFWIGDLNYRLSDIEGETAKRLVQRGQIDKLIEHDQVLKYTCHIT